MIACGQQLRARETILRVVLNLFLSQVFHWFSICTRAGVPVGCIFRSWRKLLRITIASNKSFQPPRKPFAARFPGIYHLLARQTEQFSYARVFDWQVVP